MTDAEAIGRAVQEKKTIDGELRTLRIKADRYAQYFSELGQLLRVNPVGAVFDDQAARFGTTGLHFNSKDFDIGEIRNLVAKIREREDRLKDLTDLLA
jgi:hypothetical protein